MPLRSWFTERGHPGWYSWLVVVGTALASSVLSLLVSLHSARSAVDHERAARVAAQERDRAAQVEAHRAACLVIVSQDEAFNDPGSIPPATAAGRRAASAWHDLRKQFGCDKE
jgi:heme exporter protein D